MNEIISNYSRFSGGRTEKNACMNNLHYVKLKQLPARVVVATTKQEEIFP
jgi:hypothetical protein